MARTRRVPNVPQEFLVAPDARLFHRGHDPNDRKMGERVGRDPSAYAGARIVLLGCPQDHGVRRNRGRPGAAAAPREIRRQLYRLASPVGLDDGGMFDVGDVAIAQNLEETHRRHRAIVDRLLSDDKTVVVLGGGNDISHPDVSALAAAARDVLAFNVDSHFDVREAARPNSGTPYRQLLDEGTLHPGDLYQMGCKPGTNGPAYVRYLEELGVPVRTFDEIERHGVERAFREILELRGDREAVFWGFDMDAVRSADAPGVSAGYPVGFTAMDACRIAEAAGREPRTRIFEISECNPRRDVDGRTAKLAAMMVVAFVAARV